VQPIRDAAIELAPVADRGSVTLLDRRRSVMQRAVFPIVTAVALVVLLRANAQEEKKGQAKGLDALKGTWTATALVQDGKDVPEDQLKELNLQLIFAGDKYTERIGGKVNEEGTIKIDTTKKPATIDLNIRTGNDKGKLQLGIFEVNGDTLKLCLAVPGEDKRPTAFASPEGTKAANVVFKRAKE
jgi:uncharacterized protein (TIGR03067 family)